jgi:hypothetical protein
MEIIYKAEDGTLFNNECECEEYERKCAVAKVKDSLIWLNADKEIVPLEDLDFDPVFYFKATSKEAIDFMYQILEDNNCDIDDNVIEGHIIYFWDNSEEMFVSTNTRIWELQEQIALYRQLDEAFEGVE